MGSLHPFYYVTMRYADSCFLILNFNPNISYVNSTAGGSPWERVMSKTKPRVLGVLYIISSFIIAYLILFGSEHISQLMMRIVVGVGVALIGFLAGASLILSSRYETSND